MESGIRLERREMKVSRSKTAYLYMNNNKDDNSAKLREVELTKVTELKYLGSTVQRNENHGWEMKKRVIAVWNGWRKVTAVICDRLVSAKVK